jgi:hypothetical protein
MVATYSTPTRDYELSDEDVLWLARAMVGEGGEGVGRITREEAGAFFWMYLYRLTAFSGPWTRDPEAWTLARLIQAHSRAVNPLYLVPGEGLCKRNPKACTEQKINRRNHLRSLTIPQLMEYGVYQLCVEAQEGTLENPVGEPIYDQEGCKYIVDQNRPCYGWDIEDNCFLTYDCLKPSEKAQVIDGEIEVFIEKWEPGPPVPPAPVPEPDNTINYIVIGAWVIVTGGLLWYLLRGRG